MHLTFQVKVQKTQIPFERCHILLLDGDLPIKVTHFKAYLIADLNSTHLKYPWRLLFIQVILIFKALAEDQANYTNPNPIQGYILILSFLPYLAALPLSSTYGLENTTFILSCVFVELKLGILGNWFWIDWFIVIENLLNRLFKCQRFIYTTTLMSLIKTKKSFYFCF